MSVKFNKAPVFLACSERFNVHFKTAELSAVKYLIPPVVLHHDSKSARLFDQLGLLSGKRSFACTDIPFSDKRSLSPGHKTSIFSSIFT